MKTKSLLAMAVAPMILGAPLLTHAESVTTDPVGFVKTNLPTGNSLLGISMVNPAVFAAQIESVESNGVVVGGSSVDFDDYLTSGVAYFLEITSPSDVAGHRFEVNGAATITDGNNKIHITSSSLNTADLSILNGEDSAKFVIRPHVTLGQLTQEWGAENLRAGDVIFMLNSSGVYAQYAYSTTSGNWTEGPFNRNSLVIPSGVGFWFSRSSTDVTEGVFTGEVRNNHFVQPLVAGLQLISQGFPVASNLAFAKVVDDNVIPQRNLLAGTVEQPSSVNLTNGDILFRWTGSTYQQLNYSASNDRWNEGPFNRTLDDMFQPTTGVFLNLAVASPNYTHMNPVQN